MIDTWSDTASAPLRARIVPIALIVAGYGLAVYATLAFGRTNGVALVVRPSDALALGALLLVRRAGWRECAALGAVNGFVHLIVGDGVWFSLALGVANGVNIGGAAWLLRRVGVSHDQPARLRAVVGLFFVAVVGPIPGAVIAGVTIAIARDFAVAPAIGSWWLLEAVSFLLLLPPFLFWRSRADRRAATEFRRRTIGELPKRVRIVEVLAAGLALAVAGIMVPITGQVVLMELSATVLLWFALRFGMFATSFTAAIYAACVVAAALLGFWPGAEGASRAEILLPLQATLALTTLPALLVAAIMSQRERARRALRADALRLTYALDGANDGLWDWRLPTGESFFSPRAARMFGYEPEEFAAHSHWDALMHPDDLAGAQAAFDAHVRGDTPFYEAEMRCRHKDGRFIWVHDRGKVVEREPDGTAVRAVGTYTDISERKRLENALEHLATHDALTGLANRGVFERGLARAVARQERHGGRLAVLLIDVDKFKSVNDTHGHAAGDALLVTVATRLRARVRAGDLAARLGGDEFAVVASGQSAAEFDALAARLCDALSEPLQGPGYSIVPSVSIGVAVAGVGSTVGEDLVLRADRALYAAKSAGRGTWRFFGGADKVA